MVFFKNADLQMIIKTSTKNEYGQVVSTYKLNDTVHKINLQPITESQKVKVWGKDVECKYNFYADLDFNIGDLVSINSKVFEVVDCIDWVSYRLFLIKASDVNVD